jgi:uncharacterized protein YbjT (DUF2867 family)
MVLCRALLARGITPVPVVRDAERWRATGLAGAPVIADLTDPTTLAAALASATSVVSCAHARHTAVSLAAAPAAERSVAPAAIPGGSTHMAAAYWPVRPRFCRPVVPA